MTVQEYFSGLMNLTNSDRFKCAKELAARFPSCEWCPFQADRLSFFNHYGDCFKPDDHVCKEQLRNFAEFMGITKQEKLDDIMLTGQCRCWDKLSLWLETELAVCDIISLTGDRKDLK